MGSRVWEGLANIKHDFAHPRRQAGKLKLTLTDSVNIAPGHQKIQSYRQNSSTGNPHYGQKISVHTVKVLYCKLGTICKKLPYFLHRVQGFEPPTSEVEGECVTTALLLMYHCILKNFFTRITAAGSVTTTPPNPKHFTETNHSARDMQFSLLERCSLKYNTAKCDHGKNERAFPRVPPNTRRHGLG